MHRCLGLLSCSVAFSVVAMMSAAVSYGEVTAPPTALTQAASSLGQTSATLNATVNPDGLAISTCEFQYGPTASYGKTVACSSPPGSGSTPAAVSASLSGLAANTTYHFRIVATSLGGTSRGSDETFKTLVACAGASTTTTSGATTTTTSIAPGSPPPAGDSCWEEVEPYPFGSLGLPVEASKAAPTCVGSRNPGEACYLTVTSMAFRAWNRGLAATTEAGGGNNQPFGVWIFNGSQWYPDPTFLGSKACKGNTIVWAGNLDYWLVGPGEDNWPSLCRFNGNKLEWGSLEIPTATKEHVAETIEEVNGQRVIKTKPGGITSASCFAWNDCWFFGTYGTVVHWNGEKLIDASPEPSQSLLQGEYTAAVGRRGPAGEPLGLAVTATSERSVLGPLSREEDNPPPELYGSGGETFSPLPFSPPTTTPPHLGDPFETDLVAVDLDSAGQGWVAGNPAGLRLNEREGREPPQQDPQQPVAREVSSEAPQPSPLVPVSTSGAAPTCAGPPAARFTYTPFLTETAASGSFLWSSLSVIPTTGEALAGGHMRRAVEGSGPNEDSAVGEPVIAAAECEGTTTVTRFRIPDPTAPGKLAPADRRGGVTAIAANATNDAWAATSRGELKPEFDEPPHLYRLTNGQAPYALEGNDSEELRELTVETPTHYVFELPKPEPALEYPAVAEVAPFVFKPLPATYDVKAKVHTTKRNGHVYLSLYLSFRVRRAVTIGAQALLHGRVVSTARPQHFKGHTGLLILQLERKRWPTTLRFIT